MQITVQKLLTNYFWLIFEKISRIAFGILIVFKLAKVLGPADFGHFSFMLSLVAILYPLSSLSMQLVAVKAFLSKQNTDDQTMISLATLIILSTSFLLLSFSVISVYFIDIQVQVAFILVLLSLYLRVYDVIEWHLLSVGNHATVSKIKSVSFLLSTVMYFWGFVNVLSLTYFAFVYLFEHFIVLLLLSYVTKNKNLLTKAHNLIEPSLIKNYFLKALPLAMTGVLIALNMKFDQVMVYYMLDPSNAGIYSVAVRIIEFTYLLPLLATSTLLPILLNKIDISKETKDVCFSLLFSFMFYLSFLISGIILIGAAFVEPILGQNYLETGQILYIFSGLTFPVLLGTCWSIWIVDNDRTILATYAQLIAVLLNIGLNTIMIPKFGIHGAAIATLVSSNLSFLISLSMYKPKKLIRFLIPAIRRQEIAQLKRVLLIGQI